MRVAFVTQWFPPERGTLVAAAIADGLAERGHQVDVVTGFPNYPTGKVYPGFQMRGYRRDHRSERVVVHRGPLYPSHNTNPALRVANYTSFAASSAWTSRRRIPRPDVWLTYSSPATAVVAAGTAPKRLRGPSCLIVQDLWPDSVMESGFVDGRVKRGIERLLTGFCDWTYRRSDAIGVISPGMRRVLVERGVDPRKVHDTPNWIDDGHLLPEQPANAELRMETGLPDGRLFMYAGNLGELQGLHPLVEAFGHCPEARLALVGDGVAKIDLERLVAAKRLTNVQFVAPQDTARVGRFIAASDIQIVSLKDNPLLRVTMPSKVQAALAAGRPVLAHAPGDVADLVVDSGAGLAAAPGDISATVSVIRELCAASPEELRRRGRVARRYYDQHFSPEAGARRLEDMLSAAIDNHGHPSNGRPTHLPEVVR